MVEASGGEVQVHAEIRSQSLVNPESAIMRLSFDSKTVL